MCTRHVHINCMVGLQTEGEVELSRRKTYYNLSSSNVFIFCIIFHVSRWLEMWRGVAVFWAVQIECPQLRTLQNPCQPQYTPLGSVIFLYLTLGSFHLPESCQGECKKAVGFRSKPNFLGDNVFGVIKCVCNSPAFWAKTHRCSFADLYPLPGEVVTLPLPPRGGGRGGGCPTGCWGCPTGPIAATRLANAFPGPSETATSYPGACLFGWCFSTP